MAEQKDKYGIPAGGNNSPTGWTAHKWQKLNIVLTWEEMIAVVAIAGWPQKEWAEAAATAAAESGRNPFIYNTYKQGHFGLFQISRSAHADFFAPGGEGMRWVNPTENAKEAYKIRQAEGWGAWEGHSNGGYMAFLPQAKAAAAVVARKQLVHPNDAGWLPSLIRPGVTMAVITAVNAGGGKFNAGKAIVEGVTGGAAGVAEGVVDSGAAVASTAADMAQVVQGLWEALTTPAFWMRVAYGATGVVLVVGGLMLIVRNTPTGQMVSKVATKGLA
ncbi:hypothetical protein ACIQMZ_37255 [Streptomyces longwoodensis]|uniref:hypothetical protein n=1 Tax=Streptomyces longwoodensis TaxID=68231 RepID=UPI003826B6E9